MTCNCLLFACISTYHLTSSIGIMFPLRGLFFLMPGLSTHSLFSQVEVENRQKSRGKRDALRNSHQLFRCRPFYYHDQIPENTTLKGLLWLTVPEVSVIGHLTLVFGLMSAEVESHHEEHRAEQSDSLCNRKEAETPREPEKR